MQNGLSKHEAARRLKKFGRNELPTAKPKSVVDLLLSIIKEPMITLLLSASALYFLLGDKIEAVLLIFSIVVVVAISLYQEKKSERSLEALSSLSSPRALVIRGGKEERVSGGEVVPGDLVILTEGDRVPADIELVDAVNLSIDESLLTGESVPVIKTMEQDHRAYSGAMVVGGHGLGVVYATGIETELGKIGKSLRSIDIEKTLLQKEVTIFVRWVALIGVILCILLSLISIIENGEIIEGVLAGLTLAIGILPEEFPIVLILFLTVGAWRLAKYNVLTRRAAAIETLGATTVICADKTGTITKNEMAVARIYTGGSLEAPASDDDVITYGILASQRKPFDPMEVAFFEEGKMRFDIEELLGNKKLAKEYPFENFSIAYAYSCAPLSGFELALKGAPESVIDMCNLPPQNKEVLLGEVKKYASHGLRVLAVAKGHYQGVAVPEKLGEVPFTFLGLVGLADPVRHGVKESLHVATKAGIRVIMITGDYKETALHVAEEIGLPTDGAVTGDEFENMTQEERTEILRRTSIFSRVRPNQKLLIVRELKHAGEVVAMTGDGVNDAPALKEAHIGIAMGKRGTDVAREASAIVLLDDNFNSIVAGIKMGRRIYDNLQKAINYLIAVHIPVVILSILPVVFGKPLILMPIHIVFLEMIIDPTCTIVFEADKEDADIMTRSPRKKKERIIAFRNLIAPIIQGFVVGAMLFGAYIYSFPSYGEDIARTYTFTLLVVLVVMLILSNLSRKENVVSKLYKNDNTALVIVLLVTLLIMFLATNLRAVIDVFRFAHLSVNQFIEIASIALLFLLATEVIKLLARTISRRTQ